MSTWRLVNFNGVITLKDGRYAAEIYDNVECAGTPTWSFDISGCVEEATAKEHAFLLQEKGRLLDALEREITEKVVLRDRLASLDPDVRLVREAKALQAEVKDLREKLDYATGWLRRLRGLEG